MHLQILKWTSNASWDTFVRWEKSSTRRSVRKHADWFEKNRALLRLLLDKKGRAKMYQAVCAKLNTEMRRTRNNFFRRRVAAMQLLADEHDYGGLFAHINRKYGPKL